MKTRLKLEEKEWREMEGKRMKLESQKAENAIHLLDKIKGSSSSSQTPDSEFP